MDIALGNWHLGLPHFCSCFLAVRMLCSKSAPWNFLWYEKESPSLLSNDHAQLLDTSWGWCDGGAEVLFWDRVFLDGLKHMIHLLQPFSCWDCKCTYTPTHLLTNICGFARAKVITEMVWWNYEEVRPGVDKPLVLFHMGRESFI